MIKILELSDIHLDISRVPFQKIIDPDILNDVDLCIIAGDVCNGGGSKFLNPLFRYMDTRCIPTVFVAGNHEYFDNDGSTLWSDIFEMTQDLMHIFPLNNTDTIIEGIKIFGGTGWYKKTQQVIMNWRFADLRMIKLPNLSQINSSHVNSMTVADWVEGEHLKFLNNINESEDAYDIVVTHHIPDRRLVHPYFAASEVNDFFVSDMFINVRSPPKLWYYGHTHIASDITIDDTRFICNPFGYPHEIGVNNFNPVNIIELEGR